MTEIKTKEYKNIKLNTDYEDEYTEEFLNKIKNLNKDVCFGMEEIEVYYLKSKNIIIWRYIENSFRPYTDIRLYTIDEYIKEVEEVIKALDND